MESFLEPAEYSYPQECPVRTRGVIRLYPIEWKNIPFSDNYKSLKLNSFNGIEKAFLARFYEDGIEILVPALFSTKQKKGESVQDFIK